MSPESTVAEIAAQLQAGSIVDRRAAVKHAAQYLAEPECTPQQRAELIDILRDFIAREQFVSARDDAQAILDNIWDGLAADMTRNDRQHIIGVRCPKNDQHISYFDKRRLCGDETILWRSRMRAPSRAADEFYVDCRAPGCDAVIKIKLDCGEYAP